jgi:hypothetical protein
LTTGTFETDEVIGVLVEDRAAAPVGMIDVVGRRTATSIGKEQP